jgi:CheY-like chemotaxis protein
MNLVANAAEAHTEAGTVRITTRNRYVDRPIEGYDTVRPGEFVLLRVRDEGVGISEEDLQHIFEPFYTKKVMGRSGTGLGMAVVWGTVQDHDGYIHIDSNGEGGTAVTIYFPVSGETAAVREAGPEPLAHYLGEGESVLVVDDVPEQREIAAKMLEKLGYRVDCVESGETAVARLADHPADLVVLDMIMDPGMDGLETYRRIIAIRPGQRAVIASGFAETDSVKEALRLGAGTYIKKPYSLAELGRAVKTELEKDRRKPAPGSCGMEGEPEGEEAS